MKGWIDEDALYLPIIICMVLLVGHHHAILFPASKPSESVPGFQMHSEDFPALPGTTSTKATCEFLDDHVSDVTYY